MSAVPFSIPNSYGGLTASQGLARLEGDDLALEFETRQSMVGIQNVARTLAACLCLLTVSEASNDTVEHSRIKEVRVPISELHSTRFKKNVYKTELTVRAQRMRAVDEIPGQSRGEFTLQFSRRHRDDARQLASNLALKISESRLEQLDAEINDLRSQ